MLATSPQSPVKKNGVRKTVFAKIKLLDKPKAGYPPQRQYDWTMFCGILNKPQNENRHNADNGAVYPSRLIYLLIFSNVSKPSFSAAETYSFVLADSSI